MTFAVDFDFGRAENLELHLLTRKFKHPLTVRLVDSTQQVLSSGAPMQFTYAHAFRHEPDIQTSLRVVWCSAKLLPKRCALFSVVEATSRASRRELSGREKTSACRSKNPVSIFPETKSSVARMRPKNSMLCRTPRTTK